MSITIDSQQVIDQQKATIDAQYREIKSLELQLVSIRYAILTLAQQVHEHPVQYMPVMERELKNIVERSRKGQG